MADLNLKQMAAEFGKTEKTFRKYVRECRIPHARFGRSYAFDPLRVRKFMEERAAAAIVPSPDVKATQVKKSRPRKQAVDTQRYSDLLGL